MWRTKEELQSAEILLEAEKYEDAVSRAYYAFFEMALAALLTKKITAKTHHGAITLFSKYFVKTGKVPIGVSRWMERARIAREDADCEIMYKEFDKKNGGKRN